MAILIFLLFKSQVLSKISALPEETKVMALFNPIIFNPRALKFFQKQKVIFKTVIQSIATNEVITYEVVLTVTKHRRSKELEDEMACCRLLTIKSRSERNKEKKYS